MELFGEALSLSPDDPNLRLDYAEACRDAKNLPQAKSAAEQAVAAEPKNGRAHFVLGRILLQLDNNSDAKPHLERAVELDSTFEHGYTLAIAYLKLKDPEHAATLFREMLAGFDNTPAIHMEFGRAYAETGYPQQAIVEFEKTIAANEKFLGAHYSLGAAYLLGLADAAFPQALEESVGGNYGVLGIDRPHVINTSYAYNLPDFIHGWKVLGGVTNGWTISGITTWQAGGNLQAINNQNGPNFGLGLQYVNFPSTITNALSAKTYYGTDAHIAIMPQLTCDPGLADNQQAKLGCFIAPPIGQVGVRSFPYLHGASFFNSDLSVYKTFHIRERHAVQFRISAFNFLNHPLRQFSGGNQLALPFLADYNTGVITLNQSQVSNNTQNWGSLDFKSGYPSQRIMELAVKYTF